MAHGGARAWLWDCSRSRRAEGPDIDEAIAQFWKPQTLDELMAGKKPFTSWDDLDIPDLTDDERDAFAAALADE